MIRHACALGGALVLTLAIIASPVAAPATQRSSPSSWGHPSLRQVLHRLTTDDGAPGALVRLHDRRGTRVLTSGVADLRTGAPVPAGGDWRIRPRPAPPAK